MKLGVMMALFGGMKLDDALDRVSEMKLDAVELCVGNYPGDSHCPLTLGFRLPINDPAPECLRPRRRECHFGQDSVESTEPAGRRPVRVTVLVLRAKTMSPPPE